MENSSSSNHSLNGNSFETSQHQSPTSSLTITTIASINRSNDNEFTLASSSHESEADMKSLIKQNVRADTMGDGNRHQNEPKNDDGNFALRVSHENLNCSSSESSSRCTTQTNSERNINCNKNSVSITDHLTDVNHCKNVNNSNTREINKLTPITHLPPTTFDVTTRDGQNFINGARYEMGVR
jgi:hypothetical protein